LSQSLNKSCQIYFILVCWNSLYRRRRFIRSELQWWYSCRLATPLPPKPKMRVRFSTFWYSGRLDRQTGTFSHSCI